MRTIYQTAKLSIDKDMILTINIVYYRLEISMAANRTDWTRTKDELVQTVVNLGFPTALGGAIAGHLGSPKAMERMTAYLNYVKPKSEELIVDEMLAIRSEIDAWREKKASEQANAAYNEMLYNGLGTEEDA